MKLFFIVILSFLFITTSIAQEEKEFSIKHQVKTSSVKNQYRSGTCWAFATVSFLETEIIRIKGEEYDLSEMFFVYYAYLQKAENYIMLHGNANFSPGGQAHDVTKVFEEYGAVPEEIYKGIMYNAKSHNHSEMDAALKGLIEGIQKKKAKTLSDVWLDAVTAVLQVYLGEIPDKFDVNNASFTPKTYAESLGIKADNYIELTSYTHHPYYKTFRLEIPDNWSYDYYYNLPLNELISVMDYAIENGYSVCWDGDVSEENFDYANAKATTNDEKEEVTAESRQAAFLEQSSTDDHLMHITGIAFDKDNNKYYLTKNSWSSNSNNEGGYLYMSENYIKRNTIAIMIHKDAIPKSIAKNLEIE